MKETTKNTTIGMIRRTASEYYHTTGRKKAFLDLLNEVPACNEQRSRSMPYSKFLTTKEFWDCIEDIVLPKDYLSHARDNNLLHQDIFRYSLIPEKTIFLSERNNFSVHVHIPYVNDGMHSHDHFEIDYIYHGSAQLLFEKQNLELKEGEMCILSPRSSHNLMTEGDSLVVAVMVRKSTFEHVFWSLLREQNVLASFFRASLYANNQPNYLLFYTENSMEQKQYVQCLLLEKTMANMYSENNIFCFLSLLFSSVLRNYAESAKLYEFENTDMDVLNFSILMHYISVNYNTTTLSELAERFHYSTSFFSKLIHQKMGKTFSEIIKELKLQNGKELLLGSNYSIQEISEIIGYESASCFSRAFKKMNGCSPQAFRKNNLS